MRIGSSSLIVLLVLLAAGFVHSGDGLIEDVSSGNRMFAMKNYSAAERHYSKALARDKDSVEANYNYACALYKLEQYDYALKYFHRAYGKGDFSVKGKISFNVGNAYFRLGQMKKAANMYKEALRSDPGDEAARHNLSLCIQRERAGMKDEERVTMEEAQTPETEEEGSYLGAISEQENQNQLGKKEQKIQDVTSRSGGTPEVPKNFASQYTNMTKGEMEKVLEDVEKDDKSILKEYWRTKINHSGGTTTKRW